MFHVVQMGFLVMLYVTRHLIVADINALGHVILVLVILVNLCLHVSRLVRVDQHLWND